MSTKAPARTTGDDRQLPRLLASLKVQSGDTPHPASLAVARQPRAARGNRRLAEFLRIERGHSA